MGRTRPKDVFFDIMRSLGLALTFDDVRLKTGYSEVDPGDTDLRTKFSRNVALNMPIVGAAMDTITESKMGIALAMFGGIGVIHRNMPPQKQADEVDRVKFFLNGLIEKPICVYENETVDSVLQKRADKMYPFHSFPVVNENGKLVGVMTRNDFDFCGNKCARVRDVMTTDLITARVGTSLAGAFGIMQSRKKKLLPLTDDDGRIRGLYVFSDVKRIMMDSTGPYNVDSNGRFRVAAAVGTSEDEIERVDMLAKKKVDAVVVDTAHGDTKSAVDAVYRIKKLYCDIDVVAGNVSESESARRLERAGADGVKIGQGPGSICTTRTVAGVGCPQVTAVYNCSRALENTGVPVCADGGIRLSGDITIALGAGADSVMLGQLLAGTEETPGDAFMYRGMQVKNYRGMGSRGAMAASEASRGRYRLSSGKIVPEGIEGVVPYQGPVRKVLEQHIGGLRSGMGYVGAANIGELHEKANFHRISAVGLAESHPHDIIVTEIALKSGGTET